MLDVRYLAVALVIGTFMSVTVGHVANYAGSFEANGWWWLGWPYAIAVDLAIVICAWLTRWKSTRLLAWTGYITFALASGAMNAAAIKPWTQVSIVESVFAWVYALFPTAAIVLLGLLARDTEKVAEISKARGILAQMSKKIATRVASASPPQSDDSKEHEHDVREFASKTAHVQWLHHTQPELDPMQLAQVAGCSLSTVSRALSKNGRKPEEVERERQLA